MTAATKTPASVLTLLAAGALVCRHDPVGLDRRLADARAALRLHRRTALKELGDALGPRELDLLVAFAEFLKARRAARGFAHHHEHMIAEREGGVAGAAAPPPPLARLAETPAAGSSLDKGPSS